MTRWVCAGCGLIFEDSESSPYIDELTNTRMIKCPICGCMSCEEPVANEEVGNSG